jgi:putative methionine-R-sulfoxide reductase with GAF domain
MFDDLKSLFEIPLRKKDSKRVKQIIQYITRVSIQGGGKVPLEDILVLGGWQGKKEGIRIKKQRGDLILKSRKGQLAGTFLNSGQRLRETVSDESMFTPDIIVEKKLVGFYKVKKDQLELSKIQGLTTITTIGDNLAKIKLPFRKVLLTPNTVSMI